MEMTQKRICSSDPLVYLYFVKVLKLLRGLKQLSVPEAELETNNLCRSAQNLAFIIKVFIYARRSFLRLFRRFGFLSYSQLFQRSKGKVTVMAADAFKLQHSPGSVFHDSSAVCFPPAVRSAAEETAPPGGAAEQ